MQTFLPYESFTESARCLDRQRLGNQRIEAYQVLRTLLGFTGGWRHHPCVRMWEDHERSLFLYTVRILQEWVNRGYRDTIRHKLWTTEVICRLSPVDNKPPWLGDEDFHRSHQSSLLRKDPKFYGRYGWDVPADLPYVWPVPSVSTQET